MATKDVKVYAPVSVDRLFGVYKSLWLAGPSPALDLVLDLLAEQGFGAVNGFLVPDGSYFNEQNGQIDGAVAKGDRVWTRKDGWSYAPAAKGSPAPPPEPPVLASAKEAKK